MGNKKTRPGGNGPMSPEERMKYEVAAEIGLLPEVVEKGWAGLTSQQSGRVGGLVRTRMKAWRDLAAAPRDIPQGTKT